MRRIVASIVVLEQHVKAVDETPSLYRPSCCPHCGIKVVWQHGFYYRKADRKTQSESSLNPVPIRRYCCSVCRHTCSPLPRCVAPRRWYDWAVQQGVLIQLLKGLSRRECARGVARRRAGTPSVAGGIGCRRAQRTLSFICAPAILNLAR